MNVISQNLTDQWAMYNGDCVEVVSGLPTESVGFTIYSPPFASLYTYSASDRDMGNCSDHGQFHAHYRYLLTELLRVTKPGRLMSIHCMDLPTSKSRDGVIGLTDFSGIIIRACQDVGWIYHSKVCVWKDPVTAMQRTKAIGLLHKQVVKDSALSRQGLPDYLVTMRKPGGNPEPVAGNLISKGDDTSNYGQYIACLRCEARWPPTIGGRSCSYCPFCGGRMARDPVQPNGTAREGERGSIELWQRLASPIWTDINPYDTIQHRSAREDEDERHICPLQLEVIRRATLLWSNPGDVVLSPFAGIGSEGWTAIGGPTMADAKLQPRRFIGVELKESYYKQAVANLHAAASLHKQELLFAT